MKCVNCGNEIKKGDKFCTSCGTKVEEPKEEEKIIKKCPNCGHEIKKGGKFCTVCGRNLEQKSSPNPNIEEFVRKSGKMENKTHSKNKDWRDFVIEGFIVIIILSVILVMYIAIKQENEGSETKEENNSVVKEINTDNIFKSNNLVKENVTQDTNTLSEEEKSNLPFSKSKNTVSENNVTENKTQTSTETQLPQEFSHGELKFALPSTYEKSNEISDSNNNMLTYRTKVKDKECFSMAVAYIDSDGSIAASEYLEFFDDSSLQEQLEGFEIKSASEIESEILNGITWYKKSYMLKADSLNEEMYVEYYFADYNGKVYYVAFEIDAFNGKTISASESSAFSTIKNSLKFN